MKNIITGQRTIEVVALDVKEELVEKQLKVVDHFLTKLNTNVPVVGRITIDKEGIKTDFVAVGNGPITNHNSVVYEKQAKNLSFKAKNARGEEVERQTKVGGDSNYRFTKSLLRLNVADAEATQITSIKAEGIVVKFGVKTITDARIVVNEKAGDESVKSLLAKGYIYYAVNSWSNSDERNGGMLLYNTLERTGTEAFKIQDEIFGGALSSKINEYNKVLPYNVLSKDIITRNGIFNAPMLKMGEIANDKFGVLIVEEKLKGVDDYTELQHKEMNKLGINIDSYTYDGGNFMSVSLIKYMFKTYLNIELTDEEALMISLQNRCDVVTTKNYGATDTDETIVVMAKNIMGKYKTTLVGNPDNIGMIIDKNSYKLMSMANVISRYKNNISINLYVLDIARYSETNTSGQLVEKFMAINAYKTMNFLRSLGKDRISMYTEDTFDTENDLKYVIDKDGNMSLNYDLLDALILTNKERVMKDRYAFEKIIQRSIRLQEAAVNKLKLPVQSLYLRALFDYSKLIQNETEYILEYDAELDAIECYNLDVLLVNKDTIEVINNKYEEDLKNGVDIVVAKTNRKLALDKVLTAVAIKYPCPGSEEFQVVRFLTLEETAERVEEKIVDEKSRELVYKMFENKGSGCILISPVNTLKNKLAGMDTDYDALALIFERELVDIVMEAERKNSCVFINTDGTVPNYSAKAKARKILEALPVME